MEEAVLEALERKRHKGNPFGDQFVALATAPFGAPSGGAGAGTSSEAAQTLEDRRSAVEAATTTVHVRVELLRSMRNALLKTTAEAAKHASAAAAAAPPPPQRRQRLGGRSRAVAQQAAAAEAASVGDEGEADAAAEGGDDAAGEGGFYCSDDFHQRLQRLLATGQADGPAVEAAAAPGSSLPESSLCVVDVEAELEPLAFEAFLQQAFGDGAQLSAALSGPLTPDEQAGLAAAVELLRRHTAELEASGVLPRAPTALELSAAGSLLLPLPAYLQPIHSSQRRRCSGEQPSGEGSAAVAVLPVGQGNVLMEMSFEYGDDDDEGEEGEDARERFSHAAQQQPQQQQQHWARGTAAGQQQQATLSAVWQQVVGGAGDDEEGCTSQADPWAALAEPQLAPPARQQQQQSQGAQPMPPPPPPQPQQLQQLQQQAEPPRNVPRFSPRRRQDQPLMGGAGGGGADQGPASELGGGDGMGSGGGDYGGDDDGWDWDDAELLQQMEALEVQALQQRQPQPQQQPRAPVFRNRAFTQRPAPPEERRRRHSGDGDAGVQEEEEEGIEESNSEGPPPVAALAGGGRPAAGAGTVPQLGRRAAALPPVVVLLGGGCEDEAGQVTGHHNSCAGGAAGEDEGKGAAAATLDSGAAPLSHVSESDLGDSSGGSEDDRGGHRADASAPPRAAAAAGGGGERALRWAPLHVDFGAVNGIEALRPSNLLHRRQAGSKPRWKPVLDPQSLLLPPLRPPEPQQLHPQHPAAAAALLPPPQQAGRLAASAAEAAMMAAGLTAEDLEGWDDWDEAAAAGQPDGTAGPGTSLQDAGAGSGGGWGHLGVEVEWDDPGGIGSHQQAWEGGDREQEAEQGGAGAAPPAAAAVEVRWDDEGAEGGADDEGAAAAVGYWASSGGQLLQAPPPAFGGSWQPGSEPPHAAVGEPAVIRPAPPRGEQALPESPDPWLALSGQEQGAAAAEPAAAAHPVDVGSDPWAALAEGDGGGGGGGGGSISSSPSMDVSQPPEADAAGPASVQLASAGAEGGWEAADGVQHGDATGSWWEGGDFEWGEQPGEEGRAGAQHSMDWQPQAGGRSAPKGSPDAAAAWEDEGDAAAADELEWEWDYGDALLCDDDDGSAAAAAAAAAQPGRAPAPGGLAPQAQAALAGGAGGGLLGFRQRHREIGAEIIRAMLAERQRGRVDLPPLLQQLSARLAARMQQQQQQQPRTGCSDGAGTSAAAAAAAPTCSLAALRQKCLDSGAPGTQASVKRYLVALLALATHHNAAASSGGGAAVAVDGSVRGPAAAEGLAGGAAAAMAPLSEALAGLQLQLSAEPGAGDVAISATASA